MDPPTSTAGGPELNRVLNASSPLLIVSFNPTPTSLPPDLGKLAQSLSKRAAHIGFFPECAEAQGPPYLEQLNLDSHLAAELLNYARQNWIPIYLSRGIPEEEIHVALHYGPHYSASKEVDFVRQDIAEKVQAGQIVVSPLATVRGLPKWWILPVAVIP